ncbi:MAG: hypothetical protein BM556_06620 [Bacteriovorax sp. MedPE-SWde]|nr:MAG: hypothetical protein BM556_06620 [Bacteriovorax sp. MedPE-SWde]
MKFKARLVFLSLTFLLSSCGLKKGVSSSFAKEFCSCIFVEDQSEKYCKGYASYIVEVSSYKLDTERKFVQASFLFTDSIAKYTGSRFGCQLEK